MIEGTEHHEYEGGGGKHLSVFGGRAVWHEYFGPRVFTADLTEPKPKIQVFRRHDDGQIEATAGLPDGRWAVISYTDTDNVWSTLRVMPFDELPTYGEKEGVTVKRRCFFMADVGGRLVGGNTFDGLVELHEDGGFTELIGGAPSSRVAARVPMPDGRVGVLWDGAVHAFEDDELKLAMKVPVRSEPFFRGGGDAQAEPVIPWSDGVLSLYASGGIMRGGTIVLLRGDGSEKQLVGLGATQGLVALPESAFLAVQKITKTKYGRIYFMNERFYVNVSPKALGLKFAPSGAFWDAGHDRLCFIAGRRLVTVPWEGIKKARRNKMK